MTVKEAVTKITSSATIGVRKYRIIQTALVGLFILTAANWIDDPTFLSAFKVLIYSGLGANVLEKALDR